MRVRYWKRLSLCDPKQGTPREKSDSMMSSTRRGRSGGAGCRVLLVRSRDQHAPSGFVFPAFPCSVMRSVLVVVAELFREEPLEAPLVEHDHVVEQIVPTALHPSLGNSVLAGTSEGS
jgi:hypothetical protein